MKHMDEAVKLWTADELLDAGDRMERCELWDGLPVVREPSGGPAEIVGGRIYGPLWNHNEKRRLGWVTMSSQGFLVARDPDRVLAPDVAFTSRERLPSVPRRSFFPCAPDFAVEVRSPADSWTSVAAKCGIWISHGCAVVWGVDPEERQVTVFRPGVVPQMVPEGRHADAAPALPGFMLPVASLFRDL